MMNVLFVQDSSPCIRTIKYAEALSREGVRVHLLHRNREPDEVYGFGNAYFASMHRFKRRFGFIKRAKAIIAAHGIQLIHYHNEPDILGARLIKARLGIPVVYDNHDFLGFKRKLNRKQREAERCCNEDADGIVYQTQAYLDAVKGTYKLCPHQLIFGNYFPLAHLVPPDEFLPKLSSTDGKVHIVFEGRLTERKTDHRYIVKLLSVFSPEVFRVHLYPSNRRAFEEYRALPAVVLHDKLPYNELVREMSQYDYGLVMFNDYAGKLPAVVYALGNKTYDYLCAGIPVIAQDMLVEVAQLVTGQQVGYKLSQQNSYDHHDPARYDRLVQNILRIREDYTTERRVGGLIAFYAQTLERYHGA